jgi:hypothetical protein
MITALPPLRFNPNLDSEVCKAVRIAAKWVPESAWKSKKRVRFSPIFGAILLKNCLAAGWNL